jgi:hypothetical protein
MLETILLINSAEKGLFNIGIQLPWLAKTSYLCCDNHEIMLQLIIITAAIVAISILLIGINIFVFGKKFPETEVGKNRNMIRLGLRCPHCEERAQYRKLRPAKINVKTLQPDWKALR